MTHKYFRKLTENKTCIHCFEYIVGNVGGFFHSSLKPTEKPRFKIHAFAKTFNEDHQFEILELNIQKIADSAVLRWL